MTEIKLSKCPEKNCGGEKAGFHLRGEANAPAGTVAVSVKCPQCRLSTRERLDRQGPGRGVSADHLRRAAQDWEDMWWTRERAKNLSMHVALRVQVRVASDRFKHASITELQEIIECAIEKYEADR